MHEAGLTVGEVAGRTGVAASAIRFYERQGLLTSDRTSTNQRRYHADALCRVKMIHACQRVGLTLAEIRDALSHLEPGKAPGPEDWEHLAARLRTEASERVDLLNQVLRDLASSS